MAALRQSARAPSRCNRMSVLLVRPGHAMGLGKNRLALYGPLPSNTNLPGIGLAQIVTGTAGWWDVSSPAGLVGLDGTPATVWNSPAAGLIDLSGNGQDLVPFSNPPSSKLPQGSAHLSALLGGAGFPSATTGLLQPALDPGAGWQHPSSTLSATSSWTWYLVWSRPNWRQGTGSDANPITLLASGSHAILQIDSAGGHNRLVLFPGIGEAVASTAMARRHTHSIILRYSPESGADLWLDNVQVAHAVPWHPETPSGPVMLLHDGSFFGSAQCWFHEAGEWNRALSDTDVAAVRTYAGRWSRGVRQGLYLLVNGQSNAINYAMNDAAAALLARGVAWYLGALAYNVLATSGSSTSYTMQSGHGIYVVTSAGYPGSFVVDPGDGSSPSGWQLGADGLAVQQAIEGLPAEDLSDVRAVIWPWNETDSLRRYSEAGTFRSAALRFLSLLRSMLGDTHNKIPLVWWNAIPYGPPDGITMHRQVVQSIASDPTQNVIIGNPQTSDSNPRNSSWDPATGLATGGDWPHRDSADNLRFAMLAAPVVARALAASGFADTITALPEAIPKVGGPFIAHVFRQTNTTLVATIVHDGGNDLKVPLQAALGAGFAVMDGGAPGNAGRILSAISCQRLDATHLQITLDGSLQNSSGACHLFYPYGSTQIGRGNAVTDNVATLSMPPGWSASADLGIGWSLDYPLSATFSGIPLSDTPA
jgi:hypothetical protein